MRQFRHALGLAALALPLIVLPGCGEGSDRAAVTGKVTLDNQPVDGGVISFVPTGGEAGLVGTAGEIVAGKYALEAGRGPIPGTYRVEIIWKKKTGRQVEVPGDQGNLTDEAFQVVPPTYNTQSNLTADIKAGTNTFDFNLQSH